MRAGMVFVAVVAAVFLGVRVLGASPWDVTVSELEAFQCVLYTEKTLFPLDNVETLEGLPFDLKAVRGKYVLGSLIPDVRGKR